MKVEKSVVAFGLSCRSHLKTLVLTVTGHLLTLWARWSCSRRWTNQILPLKEDKNSITADICCTQSWI